MKIILLGKNGQVGWELQRALAPLGNLTVLGRYDQGGLSGNLTNLDDLCKTLLELKPQVIVNAAAYTAVDRAEEEDALASRINTEAPKMLAEQAKALDALLVHYSTDYVFDGSGSDPWKEDDRVAPLNYYGVTKLAGERAIQNSGCRHLIFRTSWVYADRGNNFLATMTQLIQARDDLKVINDQFGSPTGAELIADVSAHAIYQTMSDASKEGLYHLVASGETNWHEFAILIARYLQNQEISIRTKPDEIAAISTIEWPTLAKRPLNSRLDISKLQKTFGLSMPAWQLGVIRVLNKILC